MSTKAVGIMLSWDGGWVMVDEHSGGYPCRTELPRHAHIFDSVERAQDYADRVGGQCTPCMVYVQTPEEEPTMTTGEPEPAEEEKWNIDYSVRHWGCVTIRAVSAEAAGRGARPAAAGRPLRAGDRRPGAAMTDTDDPGESAEEMVCLCGGIDFDEVGVSTGVESCVNCGTTYQPSVWLECRAQGYREGVEEMREAGASVRYRLAMAEEHLLTAQREAQAWRARALKPEGRAAERERWRTLAEVLCNGWDLREDYEREQGRPDAADLASLIASDLAELYHDGELSPEVRERLASDRQQALDAADVEATRRYEDAAQSYLDAEETHGAQTDRLLDALTADGEERAAIRAEGRREGAEAMREEAALRVAEVVAGKPVPDRVVDRIADEVRALPVPPDARGAHDDHR